jgi:hypothetical protein
MFCQDDEGGSDSQGNRCVVRPNWPSRNKLKNWDFEVINLEN